MCECYFLVLPLTNQVFDFFEDFTPAYVLKTNDWFGKNIINGNYTGMILCISHLCLKSDFFLSSKGTRISSYSFTFKSKLAKKIIPNFCYLFFSSSREILIYYYYFDWKCTFIWNKKFDSLPKSFAVYSILSSVRFCKRLFLKIFQVTLRQLAHIQ